METNLYFSFGMNMAEENMSYFERIGPGYLHNYKLVIMRYANIVKSPGDIVPGVLWKIEDKYQLDYLDRREGYLPNAVNNLYDRKVVDVFTAENDKVKAYIYKMEDYYATNEFINVIPSYEYVKWMVNGRLSVGLSIADLEKEFGELYFESWG